MSVYLDKFRSSLPAIQGKQILTLLQEKKDKGEIKTIEEFKAKLTELTVILLSQELTPSLKVFLGEAGEVIDSETYNEMLARIRDDLEAAFSEIDTVEEVLALHQKIINQVILKTLQLAVNELDERISLFEFLSSNRLGLDVGQFNTFSTAKQLQTTRNDALAGILFAGVESDEDATVDAVGERILLAYDANSYVSIHTVRQIFDSQTSASELDVQFKDSNIQNMIDGTANSYWIYNTLLTNPKQDGVVSKLELDLSATQDINFVEIEPASPYPIILEGITYVKNNNDVGTVSISPITILKPTKIEFSRITANKIVLKFRQYNYVETQFEQKQIDTNYYDALIDNTIELQPDKEPLANYFRDILTSSFLLEGILGIPRTPSQGLKRKYYQYLIGFDNIRVGFASYSENGIFVSKVLEVNNPGKVAVKASETRPGELSGSISIDKDLFTSTKLYHGSIEYSIVKENFDSAGRFIGVDQFPLLPVNQDVVYHERLFLTEAIDLSTENNAGFLRFFPITDAGDMKVYRNGTLLTETTDWTKASAGLTALDQTSPTAGSRMIKAIKVNSPRITDIYTVTYTPLVGNSMELPKTSGGLIKVSSLGPNGSIRAVSGATITDTNRGSNIIAKSNIYLIIILRRNSAEQYLSPSVEEYTLLAGSQDQTKFSDSLI